ncbi:Zinc finger, C2H2-type/integrase, DNA-binding protein [Akanthomyces lecanii RCEF 1005]|uniref:Zinc finger, C2H2-type/integrase, DNA-binding protein n=1 Tax=Akanthomyces lecanii RCEF 1005 TaxID=1081108 RepID=A0A167UHV8_CORDF|nr:Zinc finger, C2H2-type/integrase, DNA-binding protein [Akanthomyces lecanii RCEF 1005]OAA61593.1 Zinc finger, C2H2-type/integrase, DNA-binding protein [Akanthomyces lecanii RCEF 1005]
MLQLETDSRQSTCTGFGMDSHAIAVVPTHANFSSASVFSDLLTPPSWQVISNRPFLNRKASFVTFANDGGLTPPATPDKSNYTSGDFKPNSSSRRSPEFFAPTSIDKIKSLNTDYESELNVGVAASNVMGLTSLSSSICGASEADMNSGFGTDIPMGAFPSSSWPLNSYSYNTGFSHQSRLYAPSPEPFDLSCGLQSPVDDGATLRSSFSPSHLRASRKIISHEELGKACKLEPAQIRTSREMLENAERNGAEHAPKPRSECDYFGCQKSFCRKEHLKRHKQTFHNEGPNRFSCEFCGKSQFNRRDNLKNHRKLHARYRSGSRGVEFIAAAVPIIEQEEIRRKRQVSHKSEKD